MAVEYVPVQEDTSGTLRKVAVDRLTTGGNEVDFQAAKVALGEDGTFTALQGGRDTGSGVGAAYVDPRPKVTRIQVTPTVTATAYEAKDAIGGLLTFANAARTSGGSIHIESAAVSDKAAQLAGMTLVLYKASITAPTDEAAFDPTDTENLDFVGAIHFTAGAAPTGDWEDFNDNAVAFVSCAITATLDGTSLYGVLVARGTPTFASTSDISVTLTILQD